MTSINTQGPVVPQRSDGFSGAQVSHGQQINARESMDAGITIQTREGDLVTLNASSFAEFNSREYNSQGVVASGDGIMAASSQFREITLSTGEQFSFSVQGELSEEELADIEAIVKGVDEIIAEMSAQDMEGAMAGAVELTMQRFDTVAAYSADLSHERSYTMTRADSVHAYTAMAQGNDAPQGPSLLQGGNSPRELGPVEEGSRLLERLLEQLEAQEDQALEKARNPLDKLFEHFKAPARQEQDPRGLLDLNALQDQVNNFIQERVQNAFGQALDRFA